MAELNIQPIKVNDGDSSKDFPFINKAFAEKWGLDYFDIKNGTVNVSFVGLILKKDEVLLSFPKHYDIGAATDAAKDMKGILTLLAKGESFSSNEKGSQDFPMDAYFSVQEYYRKYGLHFVTIKEQKKGYNGRIDWRRTMRKSDKVVQDNGLVFLPFVITKVKDINVFLAECMEYILNESYTTFSVYLDFLTPYQKRPRNPIFSNFSRCVKELKLIRGKFFKDTEKNLIDSLVRFFEWKGTQTDTLTIAVKKFEDYWESMIELYLNHKFIGFNGNEILWGDGGHLIFEKVTRPTEDTKIHEIISNRSIEFDHIHINHPQKEIILFDSKYKKKISELNYKQAFYYYHLKQYYQNYKIFNGLILPTEGADDIKVHINRKVISSKYSRYDDGLLIYEYYVNLGEVLKFAQSHLSEFKQIMKSNKGQ